MEEPPTKKCTLCHNQEGMGSIPKPSFFPIASKLISRYLKFERDCNVPLMESETVKANICEKCESLLEYFSGLYQELEVIKMKLDFCLECFNERIATTEKAEVDLEAGSEKLKVIHKLKKILSKWKHRARFPRVNIQRFHDTEIGHFQDKKAESDPPLPLAPPSPSSPNCKDSSETSQNDSKTTLTATGDATPNLNVKLEPESYLEIIQIAPAPDPLPASPASPLTSLEFISDCLADDGITDTFFSDQVSQHVAASTSNFNINHLWSSGQPEVTIPPPPPRQFASPPTAQTSVTVPCSNSTNSHHDRTLNHLESFRRGLKRFQKFTCKTCNRKFTSSGHLKRHYGTELHKRATSLKICKKCHLVFPTEDVFSQHRSVCNAPTPPPSPPPRKKRSVSHPVKKPKKQVGVVNPVVSEAQEENKAPPQKLQPKVLEYQPQVLSSTDSNRKLPHSFSSPQNHNEKQTNVLTGYSTGHPPKVSGIEPQTSVSEVGWSGPRTGAPSSFHDHPPLQPPPAGHYICNNGDGGSFLAASSYNQQQYYNSNPYYQPYHHHSHHHQRPVSSPSSPHTYHYQPYYYSHPPNPPQPSFLQLTSLAQESQSTRSRHGETVQKQISPNNPVQQQPQQWPTGFAWFHSSNPSR